MRRAAHITHTVLSCGLNYAIPAIRESRWAKYAIAFLVLNELRGLYIVYSMWEQLPWAK